MTIVRINPPALGPAPAAYTHGIHVSGPAEAMYVSGQIGVGADGAALPDFAGQARQVWQNISTILAAADMSLNDIVKTTMFLVNPEDFPKFADIRREFLADHKPASTLVYVAGLFRPDLKVEVECVAIKQ